MNRPSNNAFNLVDNTIGDSVSSLKWGPNSSLLAASSWDNKVKNSNCNIVAQNMGCQR